jgi:hypothetical protein
MMEQTHQGTKRIFVPSWLMLALASIALAQSGGGNELTWSTIDSGGVVWSAGGYFELSGTIGQPDAGPPVDTGVLASGDIMVTGGFWFEIPVGDCDGDVDLRDFAALQNSFAGQ